MRVRPLMPSAHADPPTATLGEGEDES